MAGRGSVIDACHTNRLPAGEVVELMLLLPVGQFSDLEEQAGRLNQTVGQLLRRAVGEFLLRTLPPQVHRTDVLGST